MLAATPTSGACALFAAAFIAGRDLQLEKAIAVVLAALEKNPPETPKHPCYPRCARH